MEDKVYEITGKGRENCISIIDDGVDKIQVYELVFNDTYLYIGDKIKVEVFGEANGYKQAIVKEVVEKVSNHEFPPKYFPKYMYRDAKEIKKKYGTKENLLQEEKQIHYSYLKPDCYTIITKELIDAYLYMLGKCDTWEEIEKIYNNRPYLLEIR